MASFSPADGFLPDHPEYVVRQNGKFEYQFIGVKPPRWEAFYIHIRLDFTVELFTLTMCMVILDDFRIFHPCVSPPGIYFQVGWKQKLPVFINGTFYDFIASADGNCFIVSFHRMISDLFPVTTHINGFSVTWNCDILRVGFCHLVPCFLAFTAKITFDNEVTAAFKQDSDVLSSIISRI